MRKARDQQRSTRRAVYLLPGGCHTADSVSMEICSRFGLDPDMESWDEELHKREILTDEEFAYIREW